jgi:soluble lytic murein transglycosylase
MVRLVKWAASVLLLAGASVALLLFNSRDLLYEAQEIALYWRFHRYDSLIRAVSERRGMDPWLVKAIVWRESRFYPRKVGGNGERGLMQVTEIAARDWVQAEKVQTFVPTDLFDPKTNLDVGTWYLKRALDRWGGKDDPLPFALAEYNAGRSRVNRWVEDTNMGHRATADDLRDTISFPGTRKYVTTILDRYRFYKRRGRM